jgi:hypothetical protein
MYLVSFLPRPIDLRATARREVAPGLPGRLPFRALSTLDGLPLPPHARRGKPAPHARTSRVPDDRQGIRSHPYVT